MVAENPPSFFFNFINYLSTMDVGGNKWNIFSMLVMTLMLIFSWMKGLEIYENNLKKLPFIMGVPTMIQFFYYQTLDSISGIIYGLTRAVPMDFFSTYSLTNLFAFLLSIAFVLFYGKNFIKFKTLLYLVVITTSLFIGTISVWGTINMRHLYGIQRVKFYIGSFVPMWTIWGVGYTKLYR